MIGSIVFADDGEDIVDDVGSNCSIEGVDDVTRPDTHRGILRNPSNCYRDFYIDDQFRHHPISSPRIRPLSPVHGPMLHAGASIFWPDWEAMKQAHYRQDPLPQSGNAYDHALVGNEANRAESREVHETGSNAVLRKKLTVRFSPDANDACAGGSKQGMHTSSGECKGQVQVHSEGRRLNIGRIAENKFNDGRNLRRDTTASATKTESSKTGRKWYHFSFRSSRNRGQTGAMVDSQSTHTAAHQPIYAEPTSVNEDGEWRCRGRREMRQTTSYEANDQNGGYSRTLEAQGYRLLSSSVSEPEQLGGYGRWGPSGGSSKDLSQPLRVLAASSTDDLRTVGHDGRQSRIAAVRRSRSSVGDDRRRPQTMSPPTPRSAAGFPERRSSTDQLAERTPYATTNEIFTIAGRPGAVSTPTGAGQQTGFGWYYGMEEALNRQRLAAGTHNTTYCVNVDSTSTNVKSKHDPSEISETVPRDATITVSATPWSGQSWTTPRQLRRTSMTPVESDRNSAAMMPNGGITSHQMNSTFDIDVTASNYVRRRESVTPITRLQTQSWMPDRQGHLGGALLPEIRVTPATNEYYIWTKTAPLFSLEDHRFSTRLSRVVAPYLIQF